METELDSAGLLGILCGGYLINSSLTPLRIR
jgi:hypothetical protein